MLRMIGQRPRQASDYFDRLAFTENPVSKLSNCDGPADGSAPEARAEEPAIGVCYYRKALDLQSIAMELLGDGRASSDPDVIATTDKLLALVADIRADNPDCWDSNGACPRCPAPRATPETAAE